MAVSKIIREPMPYGKVLIVDDMQANLDVLKLMLSPYQLAVDTADNGMKVIELIQSGKTYDLIIMDNMMPEMDGVETTKKLRETGYTQPVIAMTSTLEPGQEEVFLSSGFDDFLTKPMNMSRLNDILNSAIRDKHKPGNR
jgi:CheY-like chemotaxis protein